MAWHILKKDVRLLWAFALLAAVIHLAAAALGGWLGLFQEPKQLVVIAYLLSLLSCLSVIFLALTLMHQDVIPGVRQDWLIRPIGRGDLIVAKLLFVVLIIQGPLLLIDLGEGLAVGFGFSAALIAAAFRNLAILCFLSLPAVAIGAATRNIVESFLTAMVCIICYIAVFLVGVVSILGIRSTIGPTGLSWMTAATWFALALTGTGGVMCLQFFRRKTWMTRALIGIGGAVVFISGFVPWRPAFALQQWVSAERASSEAIALTFDPQLPRFRLPKGAAAAVATGLYVPLHVVGVPPDAIMLLDRANIRITDMTGRTVYEGRSYLSIDGVGSVQEAQLEVRQSKGSSGARDVYQRIFVPAPIYAQLRRETVRIAVDYSLTLFHSGKTFFLSAADGAAQLDGLGRCATRTDSEGDDVQLRCISISRPPSCFTAFLEQPSSGLRNPETHECSPNYSPFSVSFWPDVFTRFGGEVPFFDASGFSRYPVDGSKLADSRLVIETYAPREHFTRQMTTPPIRLANFTADSMVENVAKH